VFFVSFAGCLPLCRIEYRTISEQHADKQVGANINNEFLGFNGTFIIIHYLITNHPEIDREQTFSRVECKLQPAAMKNNGV